MKIRKKKVFTALTVTALACVFAIPAGAEETPTNGAQEEPTNKEHTNKEHTNKEPTNNQEVLYIAHLHSLNSKPTGFQTMGKAKFRIVGDKMIINVNVHGAPSGMEHWQHIHGFKNGQTATCPDIKTSDKNHDNYIDITETEAAAGTTMIPLNDNPVAMDPTQGSYPETTASGSYNYWKTVPLEDLKEAFGKKFSDQKLDLKQRVVFIHGVPSDTQLPKSVASIGDISAQTTLPIACGQIKKYNDYQY